MPNSKATVHIIAYMLILYYNYYIYYMRTYDSIYAQAVSPYAISYVNLSHAM